MVGGCCRNVHHEKIPWEVLEMSQVEIVQGEGNVIIVQGYVDALMDSMEKHVTSKL